MNRKIRELPPVELLDELLIYNKDSGEFFWKHRDLKHFNASAGRSKEYYQERWNSKWAGVIAGSVHKSSGYRIVKIFGKGYRAHRLAYLMATGVDPLDMSIDHINQNKVDNSFSNLRLVTNAENSKNRSVPSTNTSGTLGVNVYPDKPNCWTGQLQVNGKSLKITNPRTGLKYFENFERPVLERMIADKYRELGFHENHGKLKEVK